MSPPLPSGSSTMACATLRRLSTIQHFAALLVFIGKIARAPESRDFTRPRNDEEMQRTWRTDRLNFRAFKIAVGKLLDAIKEEPLNSRWEEVLVPKAAGDISDPARKFFLEMYKSPEALADYKINLRAFGVLPTEQVRSLNGERELWSKNPHIGRVWLDHFYELPKARAALELKTAYEGGASREDPNKTNPKGKGND